MERLFEEKLSGTVLDQALRSLTGGVVGNLMNLSLCRLAEQRNIKEGDANEDQKKLDLDASHNALVAHMADLVCLFLGPAYEVVLFTSEERPPICIDEDVSDC